MSDHDFTLMLAQFASITVDGLELFRPMPEEFSPQIEAIESRINVKLIRGGNRSGKSTVASAIFASAARDVPIHTLCEGPDPWIRPGREIHARFDHQRGKPLLLWTVGYDWDHIGDTIHRLLFKPNESLKVITDEETGALRAWLPWIESDWNRGDETMPCPPLIPEHEIERWVWKNAGANIFDQCQLKNGTIIHGHSSKEAKAGDPVDGIWVDEKVEYENNVAEWRARLADKLGWFIWSTWPTSSNTALRSLSAKAASDLKEFLAGRKKRKTVVEFRFVMHKNPFLTEEAREDLVEDWRAIGEAQVQARDLGEFVDDGALIYPHFNTEVCSAIVDDAREDLLSKVLRARNGEPPDNWTREMILDPGTAHPHILFSAVPPPEEFGFYRVVYDEISVTNYDAKMIMKEASKRFKNPNGKTYNFRRFIIDNQAGQQKGMGYTVTVAKNYEIAMRENGIKSALTGYGFVAGSPDFPARSGIVSTWMHTQIGGFATLRIVIKKCPVLVYQLATNKKAVVKDVVEEKPWSGAPHDARDCLEYWASTEPKYERPVPVEVNVLENPLEQTRAYLAKFRTQDVSEPDRCVIGACGN